MQNLYKKNISTTTAIKILEANNIIVSEDEARVILNLMYKLGEIAIDVYEQERIKSERMLANSDLD